jgi:stalled ribosome rescue protein Dom34
MKSEMGLWIDHREAVIVLLLEKGEEIRHITSNVGKQIRYSGASRSRTPTGEHGDSAEDRRDRRFGSRLNTYYDEVIASLREADSILILGPGEAKVELHKRLEAQDLGERIVGLEAADKMTEGQIVAQVRQHFRR